MTPFGRLALYAGALLIGAGIANAVVFGGFLFAATMVVSAGVIVFLSTIERTAEEEPAAASDEGEKQEERRDGVPRRADRAEIVARAERAREPLEDGLD